MRALFIFVLGLSLLLTVSNIRDEIRGETTCYSSRDISVSWPQHVSKSDTKSNFRGAMIYNWAYAIGIAIIGGFGLALCRHYDRLDPLSPDFKYADNDDSSPK